MILIEFALAARGVNDFKDKNMLLEFFIGGAVALGLLAYLVYALLHPERF